jgi:hypothetical protein
VACGLNWTNELCIERVGEACACACGGPSLPKGGRSVRGTPVHLVSSRRGVKGEMMVCKVLTVQGSRKTWREDGSEEAIGIGRIE